MIPEDVWYILPEKIMRGMSTVGLYPAMAGAKYDAYKEAWHLLRGESLGFVDRIESCAEENCAVQNETESGHRENTLKQPRDCMNLQGSFDYACGFMKRIRMLRSG